MVHLKLNVYIIWKCFLLSPSRFTADLYELPVKKRSETMMKELIAMTINMEKHALLNAIIQKETASKIYFPSVWSKLYKKSNFKVDCKQYFRLILKPKHTSNFSGISKFEKLIDWMFSNDENRHVTNRTSYLIFTLRCLKRCCKSHLTPLFILLIFIALLLYSFFAAFKSSVSVI